MRTAVIGLGLIGGSLALALKKYTGCTVIGYDRCENTLAQAAQAGAVDVKAAHVQEAAAGADIVFLAMAPSLVAEAVEQLGEGLKAGAVVTDVASAKGEMFQQVSRLLPSGVNFVAGHPMAGSEKNGFEAAHADLFCGRPYILMKSAQTSEAALPLLTEMVGKIGALPVIMDSTLHDPTVAAISHMPHITAAALTVLAGEGPTGALNLTLAAGGFRDMTRVASGNPSMWADICMTNRTAIQQSITDLQTVLTEVTGFLAAGDRQGLTDFFARAKEIRDRYQFQVQARDGETV